jgi:hypothetical protein
MKKLVLIILLLCLAQGIDIEGMKERIVELNYGWDKMA